MDGNGFTVPLHPSGRLLFHFRGDAQLFHGLLTDEDVTWHVSGQSLDSGGHVNGVSNEAVGRLIFAA